MSLVSRRRTIGSAHEDSHAKFDDSNPYKIARSFIAALLKDRPFGYKDFSLRKDSYTDNATGVTHVFYRQMIKGVQVLNGDVNVSVKDGAVISHGDSVSMSADYLCL